MTALAAESPSFVGALAGRVVGGKYRITDYLASGSVGFVYAAEHIDLGERVALKFLSARWAKDRAVVERFVAEARLQFRLGSEHVTRVLDVGTTEWGTAYFVMELVEGESVRDWLDRVGTVGASTACEIVRQACLGLAAAHELGVVHRDVKGGNMMLFDKSGRATVKMLDFGLADVRSVIEHRVLEARLTPTSAVMGTPLYMAPEQLRGARRATKRSDVWSMGIVLYELLAGEKPFTLSDLLGYVQTGRLSRPSPLACVPKTIADIVARCLAVEPEDRFEDGAALARAVASHAVPFSLDEKVGPTGKLTFSKTKVRSDDGQTAFEVHELVAREATATDVDATHVDGKAPDEATGPVALTIAPASARRVEGARRRLGAGIAAVVAIVIGIVAASGGETAAPATALAAAPIVTEPTPVTAPPPPVVSAEPPAIELDDDPKTKPSPPPPVAVRRRRAPSVPATTSAAPPARPFSPYADRW